MSAEMMDEDVSDLMMMTLGNGKDEFGKEKGERNVLLLHRILPARPLHTSRLLQLPVEILADILEMLAHDKPTLANLALVNIECRQLARSAQFSNICFDYSPRANALLQKLSEEGNGIRTGKPAIGPCIRRVTMQSHRGWVIGYHHDLYESIYGNTRKSVSKEQRAEMQQKAAESYIRYRDILMKVIVTAMPNIDSLAWKDCFLVPETFFSDLSSTPLQHLKLSRLPILPAMPLPASKWLLRSLSLDVRFPLGRSIRRRLSVDSDADVDEMSKFCSKLLQLCAPTLESLHWRGFLHGELISAGPHVFPRLRQFRTFGLKLDAQTFSSILSAPLRGLELTMINPENWQVFKDILQKSERYQELKAFSLGGIKDNNVEAIEGYLDSNRQLQKFSTGHSEPAHLDQRIIPLLCKGDFTFLTSLSVEWNGPGLDADLTPQVVHVDEASLAAIGTLVSLQQLRLGAGEYAGWRRQWLVDHDVLRTCLRPLRNLKKLALCRDSYHFGSFASVESYYQQRLLIFADADRLRERPELDLAMDWFVKAAKRKERADEEERELRELEAMDARLDAEDDGHDVDDSDEDHDSDEDVNSRDEDYFQESEDSDEEVDITDAYDRLPSEEMWGFCHRNYIISQAEKYASEMPRLEWIDCGEWPMSIVKPGDGSFGNAVPLSETRDTCYTLLGQMFELKDGED